MILNVTYKYDEDLNYKLSKFQNMRGVIARTLKTKTRKETNPKFYKIMAVPATFIWQRNMDTEQERLEQNSSRRDEIFKNS
jgi:hypothetical protein